MRPKRSQEEQILVWSGVIAQLTRTRINRVLREIELSYPQFALLLHFSHDPGLEWTVTSLARAFQTEQPGITKAVKQLLDRGYLAARADQADARVRHLRMTAKGAQARVKAVARLAPNVAGAFAGWKRSEIAELHRLLERLKNYLDEHRDELVAPK